MYPCYLKYHHGVEKMQKYVLKFVYASPKNVTRSTFPKPHLYVNQYDLILFYCMPKETSQ